jgi:subtilisin family serine protease
LESSGATESTVEEQIARRDETRAALKQEENIRFAGRVLQDADTGEVILYTENFFVKFKDSIGEPDCLGLIAKYKLKIKNKLPFAANSYFVQAQEGTGLKVFEIADKLLKEKQVEFCHPEMVQERRFKAIHPLQWHLAKTNVGGKAVDAHVNIEGAWAHTRGKGVTIAVIDDGIDTDHPEFAGRIVHPFDATNNTFDAKPKEGEDNHGTPCAGMACAAGLAEGASGTAPDAFLMPIRLRSGLGSMAEANAFAWAADHGADVISCSWGPTDGTWWEPDDPMHKRFTALPDSTRLALEYALSKGRKGKGCTILFAAGNGAEDVGNDGYASYPGVLAVAACNDTGRRSVYSDFGDAIWVSFPSGDFGYAPFRHPAPITQGLRTPDRLGAAGVAGDYRNNFGGTSGACPGMAGVVALMLAVNPDLTPADIKNVIRASCSQIDKETGKYNTNGHSIWYGYGRIDAGLAVENAKKAKENPPGPAIEGKVRFSVSGELPLQPRGMLTGNFNPPRKMLGLNLSINPNNSGLKIKYKTNVPGLGILENEKEGEFVGTKNSRHRVIGISIQLEGSTASKYELEYAARIQGASETISAKNGAWCGTDKKTGKTIHSVSVVLKKRSV